jgi:hypothetical protein
VAAEADFTFRGTEHDNTLRRMHEAIPGFDDSDPMALVAGVIWLDREAGKDSDDNIVVLQPGIAMWLVTMVSYPDPDVAQIAREMAQAAGRDEDPSPELLARADAAFTQPFRVTFTVPAEALARYTGDAGEPLTEKPTFPVVEGLTRTIRVMSDEEAIADNSGGIYTATAAGERIYVQERPY